MVNILNKVLLKMFKYLNKELDAKNCDKSEP